jgi:putative transcriptional regulator
MKNLADERKHGVSFEEAEELLAGNSDFLETFDDTHSATEKPMSDIPELTEEQFARAISARVRKRLMLGQFESGEDIAALRRFVGLTQAQFALAMGISVHTLRNWEQGRRHPEGPAIALLRIAARHPRILRENIESVEPAA